MWGQVLTLGPQFSFSPLQLLATRERNTMKLLTLSLTVLCLALSAPAFAGVIYTDGPTNGTVNAFFIDGPNPSPNNQSLSDGFVATASGTAASLDFGVWVSSGTTPTSVSWWLGTSVFGSDISSGSTAQVGYTYLLTNGFGYDVYDATVTGLSGNLVAGNSYWLTLGNANNSSGNQVGAWDYNGGPASCDFAVSGVPQGDCGLGVGVEGEAFTINSSGSSTPEPGTLIMFGSGILGLAGVLRRKINL
jgi:hypothetical protein